CLRILCAGRGALLPARRPAEGPQRAAPPCHAVLRALPCGRLLLRRRRLMIDLGLGRPGAERAAGRGDRGPQRQALGPGSLARHRASPPRLPLGAHLLDLPAALDLVLACSVVQGPSAGALAPRQRASDSAGRRLPPSPASACSSVEFR